MVIEERKLGDGELDGLLEDAFQELVRRYGGQGRSVASAVVAGLEELGAAAGYSTIRLATGVRQPEAIALYERHGYSLTQSYGKYVNDELARCYQKTL